MKPHEEVNIRLQLFLASVPDGRGLVSFKTRSPCHPQGE